MTLVFTKRPTLSTPPLLHPRWATENKRKQHPSPRRHILREQQILGRSSLIRPEPNQQAITAPNFTIILILKLHAVVQRRGAIDEMKHSRYQRLPHRSTHASNRIGPILPQDMSVQAAPHRAFTETVASSFRVAPRRRAATLTSRA